MAKNTEEANVVVTMNGQAAINEIKKLEEQMNQYREAAAKAYVDGDKALGDKMTKKLETLQKEVKVTKKEMKDFGEAMKSLNTKSLSELTSMAKQLESQLKKLGPETAEFAEKSKQLQQVNTRVRSLKDGFRAVTVEVKESTLSLKGLSEGFNRYFGMVTAGIAAITGVSMAFRKTAEEAAKLDDTYSDVMKTTGLMHDEVEALDKQLMELDTRTSREQLLLLARDAGKLGIQGSENILGFVRAADQIQVALGEDLGEGAIRELGKIADVLGYTKQMGIEQSLLSIGSAVNAVGQASTASEAYLVDFTQRLAGVAAQTGISAANIIGFASGLDQSAMKVEMAATAFQKFVSALYEEPAKMAQYAKMSVQEFTDLVNNDANAAIVKVLQSLKEEGGFGQLIPIFNDLGLNGERAVTVLSSMATNLEAVTEAQAVANLEFEKANSITEEYNTKNNNMQASLDKARKEFKNASIALGQSLNPVLLKSTNATTYLIKALANYGKEIKTVLIVIAALTVALKAKVIWQKVVATWNATLKAGSLALAAAQALLTGNIQAATAAWGAMSAVMKTTIFGLIAAAISAVVIAIQHLNKETKEMTELEKFEAQVKKDLNNATSSEAAQVKALRTILEDSNQSYENRKAALLELKKIVPDYHADLTEEGQLINNNVSALDDYISRMIQAAKTQSLQGKLSEIDSKKRTELEYLEENAPQEFKDELGNWRYSYDEAMTEPRADGTYGTIHHMISKDCEAALDRLKEFEKEENLVLEMIRNSADGVLANSQNTGVGGAGNDGGNTTTSSSKYSEAVKALEAEQRAEENAIMQSYANREIGEMEFNAEMLRIKTDFLNKKLELAEQEGEDTTQIERQIIQLQIDANKAAAKAADEIAKEADAKLKAENDKIQEEQRKLEQSAAKLLDYLATPMDKFNEELAELDRIHEAKLISEEEYLKVLSKLREKYNQDDLSKTKDYLDKSKQLIESASSLVTAIKNAELANAESNYQAELTAAGDNAEKREKIEAQYEKDKLDIQKKYADAEMAIGIGQAVADGAIAIARAFKDYPYAVAIPIAALVAATTAAQVSTIIQQRNAIKNTSVSSKGSSTSVTSGGSDVGRREITGYSEGGYTGAGGKYEPAGIVHRGEWVAPKWMVKQNPVTFANLDQYRRHGSHGRSGSASRGFADGGYAEPISQGSIGNSAPLELSESSCRMLAAAIAERGITIVQLDKALSDKHAMENRFKTKTSR